MAFDLSDLLKDVSNLDTNREQIEYIPLERLDNDPKNFYLLSGVEELAANISLCGLQQPIRVRKHPSKEDQYMIVSGHRRRAAVDMLAKDDPQRWAEVPCIIEADEVPEALQQLRLIYANANTRTMTSAELGEQAAQVEKLLYQLKEEGYDFPGRMRDHVAEAVNQSKTKLARLKVIREKLTGCWKPAYCSDIIKEATTYALAQLPKEWQEIIWGVHKDNPQHVYQNTVENESRRMSYVAELQCTHGCEGGCQNVTSMMIRSVKEIYNYCTGCCFDCSNLRTCKSSCSMADAKKKELKAVEKAANQAAADAQAERDKPYIDFVRSVYERVGKARRVAGVTVEELYQAQGRIYAVTDEKKQRKLEAGVAEFSRYTSLPLGATLYPSDAQKLCAVADVLHCSIDYLLGREENVSKLDTKPELEASVSNSDTFWQQGIPEKPGGYILLLQADPHASVQTEIWEWNGYYWEDYAGAYDPEVDGEILGWFPQPKLPENPKFNGNGACITGLSPTGHCGAAACCATEFACCSQCDEPCSCKCGFLPEE
ncbi:MAG: ParB N-terminal domain-containing protein [Oscillospiraceae bacterium]|nr:ParB N-terminal domain-containing protein [Oscillospiraceae bacterium]